eukprot:4175336-Pleurochrysis_carterae.AAC.1
MQDHQTLNHLPLHKTACEAEEGEVFRRCPWRPQRSCSPEARLVRLPGHTQVSLEPYRSIAQHSSRAYKATDCTSVLELERRDCISIQGHLVQSAKWREW